MEQYISKSAVVAEIERRIKIHHDYGHYNAEQEFTKVISFLDTLEVKGVDLKEEIDKFWKPRFSLGWDDKSLLSISYKGFESIAKHFLELGLKA